ncbi:hypothetical protein [Phytoactinopolyspora mesophila]|uniref:Uncharacterized protein n=1 Tax=Phytoactinopolyspora mesophila TaxID=2650750 RepID=A0A7K3LYN6_9ACTN|nr:hypothetical protein [Phytoactinopolyspora mesophila]NDL56124.1 hypothetical protein [Phytoactinopolyspora mesophila]
MGPLTTAQLKREAGRLRVAWPGRRGSAAGDDEAEAAQPSEEIAVPLQRLLSVATLTPAQAALLARDLVGWLDAYHRLDVNGVVVDTRAVRLMGTGQVRFDPERVNTSAQSTAESAAAVVEQLVASAQQAGPRRQPAVARLARLGEHHSDVTELAHHVEEVSTELLDGGGPGRVRQVRRGLGALAVASRGLDSAAAEQDHPIRTVQPAAPTVANRRLGPPTRRLPRRVMYHRRRRGHKWKVFLIGLAIVMLVALGWWAAPRLWDELRDGWDELFGSSDPPPVQIDPVSPPPEADDDDEDEATSNGDNGTDGPADVEPPEPDSAGAVNAVRVEATDGECAAGESCAVRVEVELEPAASARAVTWSFEVVDRCDDDSSTQSGVTVTAQAGWTEVWGLSQIEIPEGSALAVMAVTETPDRASSSPMLIPEGNGTC